MRRFATGTFLVSVLAVGALSAQQTTVTPASVGVAVDHLDRLHKGCRASSIARKPQASSR
jgi:hypothetical protein